ncbi:MAG: glutathione S-transferase [Steroidobacter sp.]
MLRILGRQHSINVRKVLWTADELGLDYQHEPWGNEGFPLSSPTFITLNPNALVPVLVDGDFVIYESNAICRYLADKYPSAGLLPKEAHGRALVDQWMDWQLSELNESWRYAFMALVRQSAHHTDASLIQTSITAWNRNMAILDKALTKSMRFLVADQLTLADIVIGLSTHRWYSTPIERPELIHVRRFYEGLCSRPAFAKYANNGQP